MTKPPIERPRNRRPFTYANVAATLALLLSMSGGAFAAGHYLINSTRQISPKVLSKLKGKTGPAGKEGPQGREGPKGLKGETGPAGSEANISFLHRWRATVAAPGISSEKPGVVELAKVGPFTVEGHCYESEASGKKFTNAATYIKTTEKGSFAQGYSNEGSEHALEAGEDLQISEDSPSVETAKHEGVFDSPDDGSWGAETADGSLSLNGFGTQGVWLQGAGGPACSFAGYLVTE